MFMVISLKLLFLVLSFECRQYNAIKFPKDQRMDIVFPAKIQLPNSPGLPIGHLRPLGHQQRSSGGVAEGAVSNWSTKSPLMFKDLIPGDSIVQIWPRLTDTDYKEDASMKVLVTKRSTNGVTWYDRMEYSAYLENYSSEEWLLDQILPQQFLTKIKLPKGFDCLADKLAYISSSLTSGTTSDDIKLSSRHKLQCVLSGRRDYIIMNKENAIPTFHPTNPQSICSMESIVNLNPDLVNVFDNPWIIAVTWQHSTLKSGDCVLLPAESVVHTTSYGDCETVTFSWTNETKGCSKNLTDNKESMPLMCSSIENQKLMLCDQNSTEMEERLREMLISHLNIENILTKSCFLDLSSNMGDGQEMYKMFDASPVTKDVITKLATSTLEKMLHYQPAPEHVHSHDEL